MKRRQDAMVRCPYYKGEEAQILFCEGVKEGTAIHLAFDTKTNLKDYKEYFCEGCYNKCLIADMNNRKWGYNAE